MNFRAGLVFVWLGVVLLALSGLELLRQADQEWLIVWLTGTSHGLPGIWCPLGMVLFAGFVLLCERMGWEP